MLRRTHTDHRIAASLLLLAALAVALLGAPPPAAADDTLDKMQARALERYLKDLGSRNPETRRDAADGLGGYEEAQAPPGPRSSGSSPIPSRRFECGRRGRSRRSAPTR
jgi:hypothetical protein